MIAPFSTPLPSPQSCGEAALRTSVNLPCKVCNVWERFYSVIGASAHAEPLTERHQAAPRLNQNPIFCIIEGRKTLGEFSSPQLQAPFGVQNMGFCSNRPPVKPSAVVWADFVISFFLTSLSSSVSMIPYRAAFVNLKISGSIRSRTFSATYSAKAVAV